MNQTNSSAAQREHNWLIEKRNLLFLIFLLPAIIIFSSLTDTPSATSDILLWKDDCMLLTFSDTEHYHVFYDQITHVTLVENPDFGTCISGNDERGIRYGLWKNSTLGTYVLFASQSFDLVIQLDAIDQCYWISIESPETTEALYQHLLAIIPTA